MRFFSRIRASLGYLLTRNFDLIGLWLVLLFAQHFVPPTSVIARDDLLPWLAVTMSGVALLRGRLLGSGPHPMLTRRQPEIAGWMHRAALALAPWVLLATHDFARVWTVEAFGQAAGLSIALAFLLWASSETNQTAWNPDFNNGWMPTGWFPWFAGTVFVGSVAAGSGLVRHYFPAEIIPHAIAAGSLLGMFFVVVGWAGGRAKNHRQRVKAGRKDGRRYSALVFPSFLAIFGPSIGLAMLLYLLPDLDFRFAFASALLVIVWGAVIWPKPVPVAVACLLHEVLPKSGRDVVSPDSAKPFESPPEGALRFNPLRTKRTRVMHAWYVPVQDSRIADLDDPVRPLWPVPASSVPYHILGDARFEPDSLTKGAQWNVLTIRIKSQEDSGPIAESGDSGGGGANAATKRMVILRPFAQGNWFFRTMLRTYRWESTIPRDAVQVLDQTTETATLMDGDVLLLSTEGVAHAYEFEVGAPVFQAPGALNARPPQLGDYVNL